MNSDLLLLGAATGLALWFSNRNRQDRQALASKALEALGANAPNISISNIEAVEERRVFVFKPVSGTVTSPAVNFGLAFDFGDLWRLGVPANPLGGNADTRWPLKSASVVRTDGKSGSVPLVAGAFYSVPPAMGDLPFGSYRVRITWEAYVFSGGPKPTPISTEFFATFEVGAETWQRCFFPRIATAAEQIQAGGVVEVPPEFKS